MKCDRSEGDAPVTPEPAEPSPSSRSLLRSESTFSLVGEKVKIHSPRFSKYTPVRKPSTQTPSM
jgi:hypothetical protein